MSRFLLLSFFLVACGTKPEASNTEAAAPFDAVTASMRDAFASALLPNSSDLKTLESKPWECLYHAANRAAAFSGARDVSYLAEYGRHGFLLVESVHDVYAGPVGFPGWIHTLALSDIGLRFDSNGEEYRSEVIRIGAGGEVLVEFLFVPYGFFDPANVAVSDPERNVVGYSLCTEGQVVD